MWLAFRVSAGVCGEQHRRNTSCKIGKRKREGGNLKIKFSHKLLSKLNVNCAYEIQFASITTTQSINIIKKCLSTNAAGPVWSRMNMKTIFQIFFSLPSWSSYMFTMKNSITELSRVPCHCSSHPSHSIDDSNYIHPEFWPEAWKNSRKMRWKILTWSIIVAQWFWLYDERKKTIKTSALVNFQWNFNFNSKYETLTECQRMEPREEWACEMGVMSHEELNIFSNEINFKCSTVEKGEMF